MAETLYKAPIAIVDEDRSPLSARIADAFYAPYFLPPSRITLAQMDARMDAGLDTFALDIPPRFQQDVLAGRVPAIQLNVDATRINQAFSGSGCIQAIITGEVNAFVSGSRTASTPSPDLALRMRFNPELNKSWFGAVMEVVNNITMLSIVLTGAALSASASMERWNICGAGFPAVWPQFAALAVIGAVLFSASLARFRKTLLTVA